MSTEVIMLRAGRTRNRIVAYLAKHPGATSDVLSKELGISRPAVSSSLSSLHKTGATTRWEVGHHRFAYMLRAPDPAINTAKQPERLILPEDPEAPGQLTLLMPQIDVNTELRRIRPQPVGTEVEQLKARLAELEAFKAEAVAKHPELIPIDYEAYRPALLAFYETIGLSKQIEELIAKNGGLPENQKLRVDGLIAAAKLFPEGAAQ